MNTAPSTAWVIGNGAYEHSSLFPNPTNDARAIAASLRRSGWIVETVLDANAAEFSELAERVAQRSMASEQSLLFYAGHGMQIDGQNFVVPIDFDPAGRSPLSRLIALGKFIDDLVHPDSQLVLILDACRNNPLAVSLSAELESTRGLSMGSPAPKHIGRGLAEATTSAGTFIAFATEPGSVALDGEGENSPFTTALVRRSRLMSPTGSKSRPRTRAARWIVSPASSRVAPTSQLETFQEHRFSHRSRRCSCSHRGQPWCSTRLVRPKGFRRSIFRIGWWIDGSESARA